MLREHAPACTKPCRSLLGVVESDQIRSRWTGSGVWLHAFPVGQYTYPVHLFLTFAPERLQSAPSAA